MLKLGFSISQTIAKYMVRRRPSPSQTWRTFLANHVHQLIAADFFVVPTATYRLLFVLVLLAHDRRRLVHVAVTDHPSAAWRAQQLREAFPWDQAPRYLLRDRDHAFAGVKALGVQEVLTAAGLRRILKEYVGYYERSRTHLSLNKDAPIPRPVAGPSAGYIVAISEVGGLHHRYERRAA